MKKFFSILILIASIALGGYITIWLMLAGGILQILNSINPFDAMGITIGILRVLFCEIGMIVTYIGAMLAGIIRAS